MEPPERTYKRLKKQRRFPEALELAQRVFPSTVTKKRRRAWKKRFLGARKAATKAELKRSKRAYKQLDYRTALAHADVADRFYVTALPGDTSKRAKKRRRAKRLPGDKIRKAITKRLMKPVKAHLKSGDFVAAYAATAPLVQLFGADSPRTGGLVSSVRAAVYRAVDANTAQGRWSQAQRLLDLVAQTEPSRSAEVRTRRALVSAAQEIATGKVREALERARSTYESTRDPNLKWRARALFDRAKKVAIAAAVSAANRELRQATYKRAVALSRDADAIWAVRLSGPQQQAARKRPGDDIRAAAHNALLTPGRRALEAAQYEAAYVAVQQLFDVFPADRQGEVFRGAIRATIYRRSTDLMTEGDFKRARRILNIVARFEPNRRQEVERRKAGIKIAKAEALDRSAAAAEADGDRLAAWALARKSVALGFAPAQERARRMRRQLARRGRVNVGVTTFGDRGRTNTHADAILNRLERVVGVTKRPNQAASTLQVSLSAAWPRCYESARTRSENRSYGVHRDVANPRWPQARRHADDMRAKVTTAETALRNARRGADAALSRLTRCASDEGVAIGALKRLREKRATLQRRLETVSKNLQTARNKLKRARAKKKAGKPNADALVTTWTMEVARLDQRKIKVSNKLEKVRRAAAKADKALAQAKRRCDAVRAELKAAHTTRSRAESALLKRRGDLKRAIRQLKRTPKFNRVTDQRHLAIQVTRVRRTCRSVVDLAIRPPRGKGWSRRVERSRFTEDDAHPAYRRANIKADPLQFPATDQNIVRASDRNMRGEVAGVVAEAVDGWYTHRLNRAKQLWKKGNRHGAAKIYMTVWLGAPTRLAEGLQRRLRDYLVQQYRLRRPLMARR